MTNPNPRPRCRFCRVLWYVLANQGRVGRKVQTLGMRTVFSKGPLTPVTCTVFQALAVGSKRLEKGPNCLVWTQIRPLGSKRVQTTLKWSKLCDAWHCDSHGRVQSVRKGSEAITLDPDWTLRVQKGPNCPQLVQSVSLVFSSAPNFCACSWHSPLLSTLCNCPSEEVNPGWEVGVGVQNNQCSLDTPAQDILIASCSLLFSKRNRTAIKKQNF